MEGRWAWLSTRAHREGSIDFSIHRTPLKQQLLEQIVLGNLEKQLLGEIKQRDLKNLASPSYQHIVCKYKLPWIAKEIDKEKAKEKVATINTAEDLRQAYKDLKLNE